MFDLSAKRLVWIDVEFAGMAQGDGDEPATPTMHKVRVQVDLVDKDEFNRILIKPDADLKPEEAAAWDAVPEIDRFKSLANDWRVVDRGVAAPFSDDNIKRMLAVPNFSEAFGAAYGAAWRGRVKEREKNS